jgi:hypothetical protein
MAKYLKLSSIIAITVTVFFAGCMNMPTPPSQITGSYTSGLKYEDYTCEKLSAELDSLARRENQLVTAQNQRIKTSEMQAFWWGFGQGDGIEASELANVRGEKEAVRRAMEAKNCYGSSQLKTEPQYDADGRKIIGWRVDTSRKDADGNFLKVPVYEDEKE